MSGAVEGVEPTDTEFLRDLAARLFRTATPAMGFDQGDTDRLHRIARDLTTPPARSYADGVAMACDQFEEAIGEGYPLPADKTTQCVHGQFGWEDCIACYDDALITKIAAIRLLSQGGKA